MGCHTVSKPTRVISKDNDHLHRAPDTWESARGTIVGDVDIVVLGAEEIDRLGVDRLQKHQRVFSHSVYEAGAS